MEIFLYKEAMQVKHYKFIKMNKKIIIICAILFTGTLPANYCQAEQMTNIEEQVETLVAMQHSVKNEIRNIEQDVNSIKDSIQLLRSHHIYSQHALDSLAFVTKAMDSVQLTNKRVFNQQIETVNNNVTSSKNDITNRTIWGEVFVVLILILICGLVWLFIRKMREGNSTIDEVRKAQELLQNAQTKLQEDSIKLDNKLLEIAQRQLNDEKKQPVVANAAPDHSLALKVADEIARIEMNMSRMDPAVKGFKQLKKAVERMKDNFKANGYEIADMLGRPYNEGMRVNPDFVIDETLQPGERIITGVTKPQVLYNGELIQKATIKVSQNI